MYHPIAILMFLIQFMFKITPFVFLFMAGYGIGVWHVTHTDHAYSNNS